MQRYVIYSSIPLRVGSTLSVLWVTDPAMIRNVWVFACSPDGSANFSYDCYQFFNDNIGMLALNNQRWQQANNVADRNIDQ